MSDPQNGVREWENRVRSAEWAARREAARGLLTVLLVLGCLGAWALTGEWLFGAGSVAAFVLLVVVPILIDDRRDRARYAALQAWEARRRSRTPERVRAEALAEALPLIEPWVQQARDWLDGAPELALPADAVETPTTTAAARDAWPTTEVAAGGHRYELAVREAVAFHLGDEMAFPAPGGGRPYAFAWTAFPDDYTRALVRPSPRALASVFRLRDGRVALRWERATPDADEAQP